MKLSFIGADHEVTGSLHLLEVKDTKIAIDFGMEQGKNVYENAELPIKCSDLDYIILTHAHIDHAGMIPYAYKCGFQGEVLCTEATAALSQIMLRDSAHIQESEAEYKNRKGQRAGKPMVVPMYDTNDAAGVLEHFRGIPYGQLVQLSPEVSLRFVDAGHLLGSASVEMFLTEDGIAKKIVFSGDIGNDNKPLIRNPQYIEEADYVVMESTYGNRLHDQASIHIQDHINDLARIIQDTLDRGGNVVLPAFAVGRTQELLYLIRHIKQEKLVRGHEGFPVYVDSPLAVEATNVFKEKMMDCYDEETRELVIRGINPILFPGLHLSVTSDDSKQINLDTVPKVIISASGMCDAGRIRHHLKHNLWRKESSIVFAGYQAEGTLGRVLLDGAEMVRLFGEDIDVKAKIEMMPAMSSHADQNGLLRWIRAYKQAPQKVFLVHGDDDAMDVLSGLIRTQTGFNVETPYSGSVIDLASNRWLHVAEPRPIQKEEPAALVENEAPNPRKVTSTLRKDSAFAKLVAAYEKLWGAVKANRNGSNKDLASFTSQIEKLYDKWIS